MDSFNVLTTTASELEAHLNKGLIKSVDLVYKYLEQIAKYDHYLKAVLQLVPRERLLAQAEALNQERAQGAVRGPLHGIPILIKDNIATHPDLLLRNSAGNYALAESLPRRSASLVDRLLEAGTIIVGKTALSEINYFKGTGLPCGWSAMGGQTQSPYVRGGYGENDSPGGHSNCGGSSSGSGVSVAAGYVPFSLGAEAEGSLTMPATRAALYTIKPTPESVGPMAKSARDIATLLDALVDASKTTVPEGGYQSALRCSLSDLKIAAASPLEWYFDDGFVKPDAGATAQMNKEVFSAYEKIQHHAKAFHQNIPLPPLEDLDYHRSSALLKIFKHNFKSQFESYLRELEYSPVRTVQELVDYNRHNAKLELPPGYESQDLLETALTFHLDPDEYEKTLSHMRRWARDKGIDYVLKEFDVDVIIGPADSELTQFSAASGYPLATLPLSCLDLNGRPFGLVALAGPHQEAKLIQLQSAWETAFPPRQVPKNLDGKLK